MTRVPPGRNVTGVSDVSGDRVATEGPPPAGTPVPRARARWPLLLGTAALVLALDQLTKWWAVEVLDTRSIDVVGSLRLNVHTGAAGSTVRMASSRAARPASYQLNEPPWGGLVSSSGGGSVRPSRRMSATRR